MFCPQCGAPNEDDALFCGECGAVLNPDEASAEAEIENLMTPAEEPEVEIVEASPGEEVAAELDEWPVAPPPPPTPPTLAATATTSGMAIASLVMGIAGWTLLPLIGSILAVIFGYMARDDIRQRPDEVTGDGLAVAGLVLGWLAIGISVLVLCLGGLGACFFFLVLGASGSGY
jgi:predicted metal-binding membrane protein